MTSPRTAHGRAALLVAAVALATAQSAEAQVPAPAGVTTDPVGDGLPGADVVQLAARSDARTGTLSAAVRLAATAGSGTRVVVRFGVLDAAGTCQTAGRPSVTFAGEDRPTRSSVAQWDVPGSTRRDALTGTVYQQVPRLGATAVGALTDPALRTALTCAQAQTVGTDSVIDATAPVAIGAAALAPQVAGTVVQVDGRLAAAATFRDAHLRVGVTCVSASSGRCTGTLRVRLQGSRRSIGTARISLASGRSRTLPVLIAPAQRRRLAADRPTVIATASAAGQGEDAFAELTAVARRQPGR